MERPALSRLVAGIPDLVPFVAPEALERRLGVRFELRLGANESVFGPSPRAFDAIRESLTRVSFYGDPQSVDLRAALAAHHRTGIENVVVGSGIDDLLSLFCRAFLDPGDVAVTTLGSYPTFEFGARTAGARLERVPYRNDIPDLDALAELTAQTGAKLVYLANPDNPSGAFLPATEIERFRTALPGGSVLLVDEAYADFVPPEHLAGFSADDPGVIRLRTFSKAHGLAGLRVGYAMGEVSNIAILDRIRMHFGVNAVAQAAALASLADPEYLAWVVQETARGRVRLAEIAQCAGLDPLPSATNFVTMAAESREAAESLLDRLLRRGVFVRKPAAPPLDRCVRVTVGLPDQMDRLAEILTSA